MGKGAPSAQTVSNRGSDLAESTDALHALIQIGADKYTAGEPIPIVQVVLMFLPLGLIAVDGGLGDERRRGVRPNRCSSLESACGPQSSADARCDRRRGFGLPRTRYGVLHGRALTGRKYIPGNWSPPARYRTRHKPPSDSCWYCAVGIPSVPPIPVERSGDARRSFAEPTRDRRAREKRSFAMVTKFA